MDISEALIRIMKKKGVKFSLNGKPTAAEEVFLSKGLLPAITKRADQLASLCLGYKLGATFEEATDSLLGVEVTFDTGTPNSLRLFFLLDAVLEIVRHSGSRGIVSLDELMYD